MQTYDYKCKKCDNIFEKSQTISDEQEKICPDCGGEAEKLIVTGSGLILKRELILYKTLIELKNETCEIRNILIELKNEIGEIRDILIDDVLPKLDKDPREVKVAQVYNAEETLDKMEQQAIMEALKHSNGNRMKAAQLLGIGTRTLYRKLRQYGIS